MRDLTRILAPLVFCALFVPQLPGQTRPYVSFLGEYNQEAASSDASGIQKYSEDLIGLIVPEAVDRAYVHSLSKRLARAELLAREGKGKLVPEASIARSFDDLMRGIGAPAAWKANVAQIREFRARSATASRLPALFTAGPNGTYCNPGEATLLLYLLLIDKGQLIVTSSDFGNAPPGPQESSELVRRSVDPAHDSSDLLAAYSISHSRHTVRDLFDRAAKTFGF